MLHCSRHTVSTHSKNIIKGKFFSAINKKFLRWLISPYNDDSFPELWIILMLHNLLIKYCENWFLSLCTQLYYSIIMCQSITKKISYTKTKAKKLNKPQNTLAIKLQMMLTLLNITQLSPKWNMAYRLRTNPTVDNTVYAEYQIGFSTPFSHTM